MSLPEPAALAATIAAGRVLSREDAGALLRAFLAGDCPEPGFRSVLLAWRSRAPQAPEVAGFLDVMLAEATPFQTGPGIRLDTCGTGGDHLGTFNISTAAALVTAACGVPVVKHGGRSVSSPSGSADVLEAAGFPLDCAPENLARAFERTGFVFLFAPKFHPAMAKVAPVRKAIGAPTIFNLLGPLANPARPTHQLVGVAGESTPSLYARILEERGTAAWIIQGEGGADEALPGARFSVRRTPSAPQTATDVDPRTVTPGSFAPADFAGGDARHNAALLLELLEGGGPLAIREAVALNAGLALQLCGAAASLAHGVDLARGVLRTGTGRRLWDRTLAEVRP